jgi:tRNA uridine 5-carbamoylmethylation protein Kti12
MLIDTYFTNKTKTIEKKIIIVCGCYGSGKNYMVKMLQKELLDTNEYIHVDLDEIRQQIPEYSTYIKENPWTAVHKTNMESGYIAELIQKHALFNGYNLIINGSLKEIKRHYSYLSWIQEMFPNYSAIVFYIKTTWEKILERNLSRAEEQGRLWTN